jgi:Cu-Zn family superoxide dismutase
MVSAPILDVKSLSLLFISVAAFGCSSGGRSPAAPAPVSASAPYPLNVNPPRHDTPPPSAATPTHALDAAHGTHAAPDESAGLGAAIDPGAPHPVPIREAVAVLIPTKGSHVGGTVRFREDGEQLDVLASIDGLPGPVHAYHVHVYGDCSAPDAESAGPHFHFTGSTFGEHRFITGDLGELKPDRQLKTTVHRTRVSAQPHGKFSILGRAVVVHERGNNHASPPDGAAGKRLACGVIGLVGAPTEATAFHP